MKNAYQNYKIFDCFLFFNEFELLKVRLEYLYEYVDYFVITESNLTQAGWQKPLYYNENKHLFKKWEDKIIHNVVDFVPDDFSKRTSDSNINKILDICSRYTHYPHDVWRYENETFQRECILLPLINRCNENDVVLISDLDEFPKRELINTLTFDNNHINFHNSMRQYYINVEKINEDWIGTFACKWKYLSVLDKGLNGLRMAKRTQGQTLQNAGWHFTFLGGPEKVKEKIRAYGHQEFNNEYILSNVEQRIASNQDIFFRSDAFYVDTSLDTIDNDLLESFKSYYPISIKS